MDGEIEVQGIQEAILVLSRIEFDHWIRKPMTQALGLLHNRIAKYPPPRPNQRYRRGQGPTNRAGRVTRRTSQNLGARWTERISGSGFTVRGEVGNNVTYGPYVQAANRQAWMHRGRWITDQQVIDQNEDEVRRYFEVALNNLR